MSTMHLNHANDTQRGDGGQNKDRFNSLSNNLDQKGKKVQNLKLDENNLRLSK